MSQQMLQPLMEEVTKPDGISKGSIGAADLPGRSPAEGTATNPIAEDTLRKESWIRRAGSGAAARRSRTRSTRPTSVSSSRAIASREPGHKSSAAVPSRASAATWQEAAK
jgi:hypothetical protein